MKQVEEAIIEHIKDNIRNVPDFPKAGIQFKDITTVLKDADSLALTAQMLTRPFRSQKVDKVVGLESRGFIFGTMLALDLHAGFVPVRKPNKLPAEKISESYELEYGTDLLEIHKDAIQPGERVIIHDDLIATGGSAAATTRLVEKLGGEVVGYSFIIELSFLNGGEKLTQNVPVHSLIVI